MEITFANAKLQKLCGNTSKLRGKYGPRMAELIQRRLVDLEAAETLADMKTLPGRCHELTENLSGCLAIDLVHPDRLIFRASNRPVPTTSSGGLDWSRVTEIQVVDVGDYHEGK